MKQQSSTSLRFLIAAAAAMVPLTAAYADEENFISTAESGYFQRMAAMPKTAADRPLQPGMHVTRTPLLWEIVTYDVPPPGAQGPIRGEDNPQATAARQAEEGLWERMSPIGGEDTP